jgi:hypothetical protein
MMKRLGIFFAASLIALAFVGCSLEPPAHGHVTISVPKYLIAGASSQAGARVLDTAPRGAVSAIRLYVSLNGSFLRQANGLDYFQNDLVASAAGATDANTITLDLPATSGFKILAALGTTSGGWKTVYFGETRSFAVSAGVFTKENLSILYFATEPVQAQLGASSAVTVGSTTYYIEGSYLKGSDGTSVLLGGYTVNSLSAGLWFATGAELWLNTSQGIKRLKNGAIESVASGFGVNAVSSGAVLETIKDANQQDQQNLLVYYYGKGKDLGIRYSSNSSAVDTDTPKWEEYILQTAIQETDYADMVNKITKDMVTSIVLGAPAGNGNTSYFYLASAVGLFHLGQADVTTAGLEFDKWFTDILSGKTGTTSIVSADGKSRSVTQIALDGAASPYLYIGTDSGLYRLQITDTANGTPAETYTLVGLAGSAVKAVAAYSGGGNSWAAAVDETGNLYVFKDGVAVNFATSSTELGYVPFYAGLPANPSSLAFNSSGSLKVVVGGTDGVTTVVCAPVGND